MQRLYIFKINRGGVAFDEAMFQSAYSLQVESAIVEVDVTSVPKPIVTVLPNVVSDELSGIFQTLQKLIGRR